MKKIGYRLISLTMAAILLFAAISCTDNSQKKQNSPDTTLETTAAPCEHVYVESITQEPMALKKGEKLFTCESCGDFYTEEIPMTRSLKILAIGNSFSSDAVEYLFDLCKASGIVNLVIGNLYIGGCTLDTHYSNISKEQAKYTYYKNTAGKWNSTANTKVITALEDEEWDIVTLQQASGSSGVESTYSNLPKIVNFVKQNEPNADIYWHMTWAYQQNSTHNEFSKYGKDQLQMYAAILGATKSKVLTDSSFVGVIPSGTAIQNLRSSYVGDTVTRDGYHMSYDVGRYTVALTWFATLAGGDPTTVTWMPAAHTSAITKVIEPIKEAVSNAVAEPFKITNSKNTEDPDPRPTESDDTALFAANGLDINNYQVLDWSPTIAAYYNSNNGISLTHKGNSSASNIPNFIASRLISKSELPAGSVIIVDSGYQYRPEGWVDESYKANGNRPGNVSTNFVKVNESWWGNFTIRGFNLSATATRTMTEDDVPHFRIYVPKT